ncbi:hypothetical protein KSS87_014921 [Heliosperma pusillum]|nr:hypothetical protein KSS87_014921 [Heliosperma pusillum]
MSRNTRWKLEITKVKVVFRLQFNATHIPQTGWNNLFISFIPCDSGKASAKTNKANVRNGTCKWADPIYETTRLLQDSKTKQYEEKLYKLVVAMGTSRSSLLGEATINLSDYVDASKPTVVMLPLHGSDSGAILHVTVQLLTSKTGFREFEQQREVSDRGVPANTDNVGGKLSTPGEAVASRAEKGNQRVRFKPECKELPSLEEESGFSEGYADSAAGFDGSSNTSESLYAEKQENSSTREIDSVKSTTSGDLGGLSTSQSPTMVHSTSDWIHQWGAENSVERDMTLVYEENNRLRVALEAADTSIHELRQEIVSLQNFADGLSVETHKLTEQIAVEISSEQNMAREVSMLKLECLRFKNDLERVRNLKINPPVIGTKLKDEDLSRGLLKGLKDAEDKICQLQNKAYNGLDGKDLIFLKSDLEEIRGAIIDLRQATIIETSSAATDHAMSDTGLGVELCHPEGVLLPGLLTSGTRCVDVSNEMQGEIFKLLRELDESKADRENLVQKMDQMECYYEALIQELEVNQKQILGELQNLRHEHSSCIYTVSSTKAQMEAMHQEMNNELLRFAEERCTLDALNKELERRASNSEAALRRARLNYSVAVNHLQKDLEVLSLQVVSMYETNEKVIRKALSEASLPFLQDCEENEITADVGKTVESPICNIVQRNRHLESDRLLEDLKNSLVLQEDLYRKMQEELSEMHLENLNLDVFSVTLHQALLEAGFDSRTKMHDIVEKLELSTSRSTDLALENQTLEAKLRRMSDEKCTLSQRIGELESLMSEYKEYKSNYEICDGEMAQLAKQLEEAAKDKHLLSNEVSLLQEELMTIKVKVIENEKLQKVVSYMRENLDNLLAYGDEQVNVLLKDEKTDCEEFTSIITRLGECLQNFHGKIFQLKEEKANLMNERDVASLSFASALNASSALVEKLQNDMEAVNNKLQVSFEAEEKHTQVTRDLLSDFTKMEDALKGLTLENRDLKEKIMLFGSVSDELEGYKVTLDELKQENFNLTESLQCKVNECDMLTKEHDSLKENVGSLKDEMKLVRGVKDQLGAEIMNLNCQLKDKDENLGQHDQRESEINHLKQRLNEALEKGSSANLELQLMEMHGLLIAEDIEQTVAVTQYKLQVQDLLLKLEDFHQNLDEVDRKNLDLASRLSNCLADKENYAVENANLLSDLYSLKSKLEHKIALVQVLETSNRNKEAELEEYNFETKELKCLLRTSQNEIEDLIFSKEELEIRFLVMQTTIDEMSADMISHGECREEQEILHKKCSELNRKLSEQILKAEEFKNLSIHLKELKDKAEADHLQAQEKRETEGSSFASQDSLRIAFIKEQYETKLQEIRQQLSISKKHGEEMLWKLQDALEELENKKKCEASQLKRNEELMLKITGLEAELQLVVSDNREKFGALEQLKAELDCSVMSLDCVKDEKNQLMVSLQECNDYRRKLADEVEILKASMRREEVSLLSTAGAPEKRAMSNSSSDQANHLAYSRNLKLDDQDEGETIPEAAQETMVTEATEELKDLRYSENDVEHNRDLLNDQLKPQFLLSSIERLQKELEWMKSENTRLPGDGDTDELAEDALHRDQVQLETVSEELENISSLYNESSRSGNSVERVLALELELAEVLRAKKKPSVQFQSSFLKLHRDEAAVFQSFRDINELIKDMLEMKERHTAMETELKDMHDRYSQLSLHFAEVEGERQKLTMMLKNVRPSKRLCSWPPTSSHEELSS